MLCGRLPFLSEGFGDIIIMHVMKEPEPPQLKNPAVPPEFERGDPARAGQEPRRPLPVDGRDAGQARASLSIHTGPINIYSPSVGSDRDPDGRASREPIQAPDAL